MAALIFREDFSHGLQKMFRVKFGGNPDFGKKHALSTLRFSAYESRQKGLNIDHQKAVYKYMYMHIFVYISVHIMCILCAYNVGKHFLHIVCRGGTYFTSTVCAHMMVFAMF